MASSSSVELDAHDVEMSSSDSVTVPEAAEDADAPHRLDHFELGRQLGAGGMGIVFEARDALLDRRVALKLVRPDAGEGGKERLLREAKALARLSHPNVVTVYEVGEVSEQVFIAMELIEGATLREWLTTPRRWREVVSVFLACGRGLGAMHAIGLVHRDFKPANVLIDRSGTAKVGDFGLVQAVQDVGAGEHPSAAAAADAGSAAVTRTGAVVGTHAYMAPEQARGESSTLADQYSFCVAHWEGLYGARPGEAPTRGQDVPTWLRAILRRGLSTAPSERWPSMHHLLREIAARHERRRWTWIAAGGATALAAVTAFAIGSSASSERGAAPCSGAADEIASAWNPELRARTIAHLEGLESFAAGQADRMARTLDDYATGWVSARRDACLAHERKELTPNRYEARVDCLSRTREQLMAVGELMTTVDAEGFPQAAVAASSLSDVGGCADAVVVVPPPASVAAQVEAIDARIERVRVHALAHQADVDAEAHAVSVDARTTGYEPLLARALLAEGLAEIEIRKEDYAARGSDIFLEAMMIGLRAGDDVVAVEAYARWLFVGVVDGKLSLENWTVMEALAERLGQRGRLARAFLYNSRGLAAMQSDSALAARVWLERAASEAGSDPETELLAIFDNLANVAETPEAAERDGRRAVDRWVSALGADHPRSFTAHVRAALLTRDIEAARTEIVAACAGFERWQEMPTAYACDYAAGWLLDAAGDVDEAVRWMARIPEDDRASGENARIASAYVALQAGTRSRSAIIAEMEAIASAAGQLQWERSNASDALVVVALASETPRAAAHAWRRAIDALAGSDVGVYRRQLARARLALAENPTTPPAEAARLAEQALTWYRGAGGAEAIVARLERIRSPEL